MLSKSDFLNSNSRLKKELIELPEMGGSVYVREMNGLQLLSYNQRVMELQKTNKEITPTLSVALMALMVSMTVCDETGELLFTESDAKQLAQNSISVLMKLSTKALEISGLSKAVINEVNSQLKNALPDSSITG